MKKDLLIEFNDLIKSYPEKEQNIILDAYNLAELKHKGQKRASGEEYIIHPLSVAINLLKLNVDYEMVVAGLLHDIVEDTDITLEDLKNKYGENISKLVDGVTKISKLKSRNKREQRAETIRKMLVAMTNDIRVIIVKLADKLHNMSTLEYLPKDKIKRISRETLEIYAPLAGKIGMNILKNELENLSLKALHSEIYENIKNYLETLEKDFKITFEKIIEKVSEKLNKNNIPFIIKSRKKHFYSIYKKMKKYNKNLDQIFDIFGIRIITDTIENCYKIFGIVHSLWQPMPGRFKDYIANPKQNGYRSLHTTVIIQKGKVIEVQIRTEDMDEINEYGVAAHWFYKKGGLAQKEDLKWLQHLREVNSEKLSPEEYYKTIRDDILKDEIYVFTPKGDIIELPKGSTALDFAYRIHTDIGNKCRMAKANGNIISLSKPLKNGMIVEIITGPNINVKPVWLSLVRSRHAKKKIRHELINLGIKPEAIEKKDKKESVKEKIVEKKDVEKKDKDNKNIEIKTGKITIVVNGEKNLLFNFAKCCNPIPYNDIIGFVSRGRGIIIHKRDCPNLKNIKDFEKRSIEVNWD